ncbi:WD repeat-containing protein 53 isoform X2 [Myotis lucifugus]|uniref:WD repeat-containing protein 53 isoform X2 n=1 Tax=Myotis lucifugus TaxID=59463 RepID=UPI000CCC7378|nr:WD repeat-containing protein 53 isoform X2 [Myotis lucifugus]
MRVEGTKQGRTPSSLAVPLAPEVTVWRRRLAPYAARDWAPAGEVITRRRGGTREEQCQWHSSLVMLAANQLLHIKSNFGNPKHVKRS